VLRRFGTHLKRLGREERGSVLVEMTLITPLMIALSAGVFEFGNLIHKKLLIEAGLRDAARYYARCNESLFSDAGLSIDCDANAQNIAFYGNVAGTGDARVDGWAPGETGVTFTFNYDTVAAVDGGGNRLYRSSGPNVVVVRIDTSFPYTGTSLLGYLGLSPITLNAAHEERTIGW